MEEDSKGTELSNVIRIDDERVIAHQKLMIAKLQREKYGQRSERSARLIGFHPAQAAWTESGLHKRIRKKWARR